MKNNTLTTALILFAITLSFIFLDVLLQPKLYQSIPYDVSSNENINAVMGNTNLNHSPLVNTNSTNDGNTNADIANVITVQTFTSAGLNNVKLEEGKKGKDLFGMRLENMGGTITKKYIYQDDFPLGYVYEATLDGGYEALKKMVTEKVSNSPVWQMNETNSYGKRSFYMNNTNRADTVFAVIEYSKSIIAFEYPRNNHNKFQLLFEYLKTLL